MPRWNSPADELPEDLEVGDRIVIIVRERRYRTGPLSDRLVILEATETGWRSPDEDYDGCSPEDGVLWTTEKSVCEIANVLAPPNTEEG